MARTVPQVLLNPLESLELEWQVARNLSQKFVDWTNTGGSHQKGRGGKEREGRHLSACSSVNANSERKRSGPTILLLFLLFLIYYYSKRDRLRGLPKHSSHELTLACDLPVRTSRNRNR